jgi:predicted DNA-binding transcriptional regulator AlpA
MNQDTNPTHAPPLLAAPLLVNEAGAAALLGLKPRTLTEWRMLGTGPAYVRISNRCIRYRLSDLDAWAAERVRTSTSDPGAADEPGRG